MKLVHYIFLAAFLALLLGAAFYFNKDSLPQAIEQATTTPNGEEKEGATATSTIETTSGGGTIEILPPEEEVRSAPTLSASLVAYSTTLSDLERIGELRGALQSDPRDYNSAIGLGISYKQIGAYALASDIWEHALLLAPGEALPLNNLGNLYHYQIRDFARAEQYFLEAIENNPNFLQGYQSLFELYTLSYPQGDPEALLLEGLSNNPGSLELLLLLADYNKEHSSRESAIERYEEARSIALAQGREDLVATIDDILRELAAE